MGSIDLDEAGNVAVRLDSLLDVAQLRVALKSVDGADEIELAKPGTVTLSAENPFHYLALRCTDFEWSSAALRAALDSLAEPAQSALRLHTKSHRALMRRLAGSVDPAERNRRAVERNPSRKARRKRPT